jgi:conserved hypothetical protein|nr:MAG TPA: ASCH domain protein [Caudoviricetes sp.]
MDRPILFSTPMVRAILAGRKTMTRRVAKPKFQNWQVKDRLWVRETYCLVDGRVVYAADCDADTLEINRGEWKPSIFMPRKYSRILLEITGLKREQLQDISEADAKREGVNKEFLIDIATFVHGSEDAITKNESYKLGFRSIWEQINGRDSWKQNPEVVAIGFKVLEVQNEK